MSQRPFVVTEALAHETFSLRDGASSPVSINQIKTLRALLPFGSRVVEIASPSLERAHIGFLVLVNMNFGIVFMEVSILKVVGGNVDRRYVHSSAVRLSPLRVARSWYMNGYRRYAVNSTICPLSGHVE